MLKQILTIVTACFTLALLSSSSQCAEPVIAQLDVWPREIVLTGGDAAQGILVTGKTAEGWEIDLTRQAALKMSSPGLVRLEAGGLILPAKNGTGDLEISAAGRIAQIQVRVENIADRLPLHFERDIEPILSRFGCNTSGCHGKAEGQNGFKLSVFGYDPTADRRALTSESRGRRIFPASPERSLFLLKASGGMPHGGGVRIPLERPEYATLREWIATGMPEGPKEAAQIVKVELVPSLRRMQPLAEQQLRVIAEWSDGRRVDVTRLARFQSNNEGLATIDEHGLVTAGTSPGTAAIMASYAAQVAVFTAVLPRQEKLAAAEKAAAFNFIDQHVQRRLTELQIAPSQLCTDEEFLRRVHLDLIGTLPAPTDVRRFVADERENRRQLIVEELFKRPEFADHWALFWADLLRVDRQVLGHKAAYDYYRWIREQIRDDVPLDEFARRIITAEGPLEESPAGWFYKTVPQPGQAASAVSQVFLGIRLECAQCHHHPHDRWSQTDYHGMAAYFSNVQRKNLKWGETLLNGTGAATKHPRTSERVFAHPLGQPMPTEEPAEGRAELARWLTADKNPWFARNLANRLWARLLGRGLIEPVDDVRLTNPPSNPELLTALAEHLSQEKFHVKSLLRAIVASRTYQQSSLPNATNRHDEQNYSRFLLKPLPAETLLDAVSQATGVAEPFAGMPAGTRAVQLWDSQTDHDFLRLFGRPTRQTNCECDRVTEPSVGQVLHLLNSERVQEKLSNETGVVARLASQYAENGKLIDELYLAFLSRLPSPDERRLGLRYLERPVPDRSRRQGAEDLAWSLLNSHEFVFNH